MYPGFVLVSLQRHNLSGILLAATAFALLTVVDITFKLLATGHPACQLLMVNGCFALLPIFGWTAITGGRKRLRTTRPLQHIVRGCASAMSTYAFIYAYSRMPLTDFYTMLFTGPLIVTALSSFWLGEKIDVARWLAILAGFGGVVLTANPFQSHGDFDLRGTVMAGRFAALLGVFCYALSVIMVRRMRSGETNMTFSFYGYLASIAISVAVSSCQNLPHLSGADIVHLALSGTVAGISGICLMTAYHRTPVALVAPFQYTQMIWGAIASYAIWAQIPSVPLVIGACIVMASGSFVIYREMRPPELIARPSDAQAA